MDAYIFGDEAGNLPFNPKASRYFILTTVTLTDWAPGNALLNLRRQLALEGCDADPAFHCTSEFQHVRDRVYGLIQQLPIRVDATVFEKRKIKPHIRRTEADFYEFAWFYHLSFLCAYKLNGRKNLLVVPATMHSKAKIQDAFSDAVRGVVGMVATVDNARCAFWKGSSDPCLWLADYCCWAIQRKWEHPGQPEADMRSYDLIRDKVKSEFEFCRTGTETYY